MVADRAGTRDFSGAGEMLLIDKPLDWTSFRVVRRVRTLFNAAKAGHAGTLDPRATGLMIVCTGKQTKKMNQYVDLDKEYVGTFELGVRTASHDSETPILEQRDFSAVTLNSIRSVAEGFVGRQLQRPPMYSAAKHHGKPLYAYARKGRTVEREPKEIEIQEFEISSFAPPFVEFRVVCSKGTYVRTLVDDVGAALGCGATLRSLRRTRIGPFHVKDALSIDDLTTLSAEVLAEQRRYETGISA
jgi:tRNA pseudouridine55 synthase